MIKITLPSSMYTKYEKDILQAVARGEIIHDDGNTITQEVGAINYLTIDKVKSIVSDGGEVENFWIGIEKAKASDFIEELEEDEAPEYVYSTVVLNNVGKYMAEILNKPFASSWVGLTELLSMDDYRSKMVVSEEI